MKKSPIWPIMEPRCFTPKPSPRPWKKKFPLRVLNTFVPDYPGTRIVEHSDSESFGSVKAITAIRSLNLVTVAGRGMLGVPGIAARTFNSVARVSANVLMISQSSSEQSICFVVPESCGRHRNQCIASRVQDRIGVTLYRPHHRPAQYRHCRRGGQRHARHTRLGRGYFPRSGRKTDQCDCHCPGVQ